MENEKWNVPRREREERMEIAKRLLMFCQKTAFSGPRPRKYLGCRYSKGFLALYTKTAKIYQMATKYTKWPQNIPNGN
jgi:hypothetical protein